MKKNLWFIGILLMSIFMSSSKCSDDDEGHKYITFVNNSTNDIRVQERWQIQIELSDTILDSKVIPPLLIANKSSHEFKSLNSSWEIDFNAIPFVQYFIIDENVYTSTPWDSICKYNKVMKRYQFTKEELERMNWTVTYP